MKYIYNFLLIILIFSIIFSCEKHKKKDLITTNYFNEATDLKTLKNYEEIIINDSVKKVSGFFSHYKVDGFIDNNRQKINWWNIKDNRQGDETNAKVEYRIIDNKSIVNQFVFFTKNQGIYNINSKYYKIGSDSDDNFTLFFYTPNKHSKVKSLATFNYFLYYEGKEIEHKNLDCKKELGFYSVSLSENSNYKKKVILKGLFTEIFQDELNRMGQNEIYVLDTLVMKN